MDKPQKVAFWKYLWAIWLAIHFLLFFIFTFPLFYLLLARKAWYPLAHQLRRIWGAYIMAMMGIYWKVEFEEKLDPKKTYVFAPNHSSYIDIPALAVLLPGYFSFMAKSELSKIPLFGVFFGTIDIAVNRKSAIQAHKAFQEAGERLEHGISICLFPEGTIPKSAPALGKFKDGPFRLAIEKGVEIVPITLPDNHLRLPDKGSFYATPGKMRMFVHRPISAAGLKLEDTDSLKQEVYRIIETKLASYAHHR